MGYFLYNPEGKSCSLPGTQKPQWKFQAGSLYHYSEEIFAKVDRIGALSIFTKGKLAFFRQNN